MAVSSGFQLVARDTGPPRDRYRPQQLSEVVPTFSMKEARAILESENVSQVYLFEGLTGCGKTTLARIISRALVCESPDAVTKPCLTCAPCKGMEHSPDFTEINIADFRGIDAIRDNISGMSTLPGYLKRKVYIFDEAHQLTPAAQEMLNKVLEEPIGNTVIFLCTTNLKGLRRTLLGRCAQLTFKRVTRVQMQQVVKQVVGDAGLPYPNDGVFEDMFMQADGSIRDLMNLLDRYLLGAYEVGVTSTSESGA